MKVDKEEQSCLKEEEETRLIEELRLKDEDGGFCGAGMDR